MVKHAKTFIVLFVLVTIFVSGIKEVLTDEATVSAKKWVSQQKSVKDFMNGDDFTISVKKKSFVAASSTQSSRTEYRFMLQSDAKTIMLKLMSQDINGQLEYTIHKMHRIE